MAINVIVRYNGGLLPDIILLTQYVTTIGESYIITTTIFNYVLHCWCLFYLLYVLICFRLLYVLYI